MIIIYITFTDQALAVLESKLSGSNKSLRLDYDIEGCGCVNDGVTHLVQIESPDAGDLEISSNKYKCYLPSQYQIYFDEHLTIDYSTTYKIFQLKSPERILNPRMAFKTTEF